MFLIFSQIGENFKMDCAKSTEKHLGATGLAYTVVHL